MQQFIQLTIDEGSLHGQPCAINTDYIRRIEPAADNKTLIELDSVKNGATGNQIVMESYKWVLNQLNGWSDD
jgi:hypothetical protein